MRFVPEVDGGENWRINLYPPNFREDPEAEYIALFGDEEGYLESIDDEEVYAEVEAALAENPGWEATAHSDGGQAAWLPDERRFDDSERSCWEREPPTTIQ